MAPNSEQDLEGVPEEAPETRSGDAAGAEARKGPPSKAPPQPHDEACLRHSYKA